MPFTVALDRSADEVRPFIEAANVTHPSVIDTEHKVAEFYHIVNVPTIIWIDEQGQICRPHDAQFGTDTFTQFHGKNSAVYLDMIRAWVRSGEGAMSAADVAQNRIAPTEDSQLARAERALAWHLSKQGRDEAAALHFRRAGELAPKDWTIRRGSLPIRGEDPFGPAFFELAAEGASIYPMDAITPTQTEKAD